MLGAANGPFSPVGGDLAAAGGVDLAGGAAVLLAAAAADDDCRLGGCFDTLPVSEELGGADLLLLGALATSLPAGSNTFSCRMTLGLCAVFGATEGTGVTPLLVAAALAGAWEAASSARAESTCCLSVDGGREVSYSETRSSSSGEGESAI